MIATSAVMTTIATKIITAMLMLQSSELDFDVARLARTNKYVFIAYIGVLAATVILSIFLWTSGNKLQDAIKRTSEARTEEAKRGAEEARKQAADALKDAGVANKRAGELESANLILRDQVATLEKAASDALAEQQRVQTELEEQRGRTATLEKKASDALAAQQRVETALAEQQERAAKAEKDLEQEKQARVQVTEAVSPRLLELGSFSSNLHAFNDTQAIIEAVKGDETYSLAGQIARGLKQANWLVPPIQEASDMPEGIVIEINEASSEKTYNARDALIRELTANQAEVTFRLFRDTLPQNVVKVRIGRRPMNFFYLKKLEELIERETDPQRKKSLERARDMLRQQLEDRPNP